MSNKLALVQKDYPPEKVELIKRMVAPTATDDELVLFLYQAQRTGLDPLARQIIFNKFNSNDGPRMSIITSIDGYRLVADRTGKYAGNDDPAFEGEPNPTKATVTVYKLVSGIRCAFTAAARWSEYYPGDKKGFMWRKMPFLMLGKCAEALALRKAFPAELSGLYTDTEMEQAGYIEDEFAEAQPAQQPPKVQHWSQAENNQVAMSGKLAKKGIPLWAFFKANEVKDWDSLVNTDTGKQAFDKAVTWWEANKPDGEEALSPELQEALNGK